MKGFARWVADNFVRSVCSGEAVHECVRLCVALWAQVGCDTLYEW